MLKGTGNSGRRSKGKVASYTSQLSLKKQQPMLFEDDDPGTYMRGNI
jgi:hypothetical protein